MPRDRAPFAPSPRPAPPISAQIVHAHRTAILMAGCTSRVMSSTRTFARCDDPRCRRWLFLPAGRPLTLEDRP